QRSDRWNNDVPKRRPIAPCKKRIMGFVQGSWSGLAGTLAALVLAASACSSSSDGGVAEPPPSGAPSEPSETTSGGATTDAPAGVEAAAAPDGAPALSYPLRITAIKFFQGIGVTVMEDGAAASQREVPIVAGRNALVRVYVAPKPGANLGTVAGRLRI